MIELFGYSLSHWEVGLLASAAMLIGMSKTGVHGAGMIAVPLLVVVFGGKNSSGLLLPIMIFADFFGVKHYHRHAEWKHLKKLIPFVFVGVILGTVTGSYIDDVLFRQIMAGIIFASLGVMIWMEKSDKKDIPSNTWFAITIGILGGFTSMVGNLAGSVMAIFLLSMQLPKNSYIGTAAWFFFVLNVAKVPFHIFAWETITLNSFLLDLTVIPLVAIGAFCGIWIVKRIPEKAYRIFIIVMTALAAVFMLT